MQKKLYLCFGKRLSPNRSLDCLALTNFLLGIFFCRFSVTTMGTHCVLKTAKNLFKIKL